MRKQTTLDEVITSLYEAAADAALWRLALAKLADLFRPSFAGHFFSWDRDKNITFAEVDREELAAANEDYVNYYGSIDPRAALAARGRVGVPFACHHHFDDRYVAKSEFYQDFMLKIGGRYVSGLKLFENDRLLTITSVHRNTRQGPFEETDLRLLKQLQPHLSQAANLFHKFNDLRAANDRAAAGLDHVPWGVLVADRTARILEMNAAAEAHLRKADVLKAANGRLFTIAPAATASLHAAISAACSAAGGQDRPPGGVVRVDRTSGSGYLAILVAPLRQAACTITTAATAGAILFISDSEARPRLASEWLRALFGLTAAEASVALSIAAGKTLEEIAEMNAVSKNTVRVQTQSVLEKMGVQRQSEIVRLVLSIPNPR
jgi:DNA-binding CsgD family transcriptional regulator